MSRVLSGRLGYRIRKALRFLCQAALTIIAAFAVAVPVVAYQNCVFKKADPPADIALVCVNRGVIKPIGSLDPANNMLLIEQVDDQTSGSTAVFTRIPQIGKASVNIYPGNSILRISNLSDRMCFRCMFRIIGAAWDTTVPGYAVYDGVAHQFYPVTEGTVAIGPYTMTTRYISESEFNRAHYRIEVTYA